MNDQTMGIMMKLQLACFGAIAALSLSAMAPPAAADDTAAGLSLYAFPNQAGPTITLIRDTPKLKKLGFSSRAMSMKVNAGRWEVCTGKSYHGACEVFGPGVYNFSIFNWGNKIKSVRRIRPGTPTITLFAQTGMKGQKHTYAKSVGRLKDITQNSIANSVKVRGGAWVLCENSKGKGNCETVDRDVTNIRRIGLSGAVLSLYTGDDWARNQYSDNGGAAYGGGLAGGNGGYNGPANGYNNGYNNGRGNGYNNGYGTYPMITLYDNYRYGGANITLDRENPDLRRENFSNRAMSLRINSGTWEICDGAGYTKTCRRVNRDVPDLSKLGLQYAITSVRPVMDDGYGGGYDNSPRMPRYLEGQRTTFFPSPERRGQPIATCLYPNNQCGRPAAQAFCRSAGYRTVVYFDDSVSRGPVFYMGNQRSSAYAKQRQLVDVLCAR